MHAYIRRLTFHERWRVSNGKVQNIQRNIYVNIHLPVQALRKLNNNPEFFSTEKRLIVEFAVEDMKKAKLHMEKQAKALAAAVCALFLCIPPF